IDNRGQSSLVATATYHKLPHHWTIKLDSKYSRQYAGGGADGLIDGIRGTTNFSDGAWQGYEGQDLVATIDLGETQSVSKLGAGFLQNVESWIWMPRSIDFALSTDGQRFVTALSIPNDVSERGNGTVIKEFSGTIKPQRARYVRIRARTYGKIPDWHPG